MWKLVIKLFILSTAFIGSSCASTLSYDLWWIKGGILSIRASDSHGYSSDWFDFKHYKPRSKVCSPDNVFCIETGIEYQNSGRVSQAVYYKGLFVMVSCDYKKVVSTPPVCFPSQPCPEITHWECSDTGYFP